MKTTKELNKLYAKSLEGQIQLKGNQAIRVKKQMATKISGLWKSAKSKMKQAADFADAKKNQVVDGASAMKEQTAGFIDAKKNQVVDGASAMKEQTAGFIDARKNQVVDSASAMKEQTAGFIDARKSQVVDGATAMKEQTAGFIEARKSDFNEFIKEEKEAEISRRNAEFERNYVQQDAELKKDAKDIYKSEDIAEEDKQVYLKDINSKLAKLRKQKETKATAGLGIFLLPKVVAKKLWTNARKGIKAKKDSFIESRQAAAQAKQEAIEKQIQAEYEAEQLKIAEAQKAEEKRAFYAKNDELKALLAEKKRAEQEAIIRDEKIAELTNELHISPSFVNAMPAFEQSVPTYTMPEFPSFEAEGPSLAK